MEIIAKLCRTSIAMIEQHYSHVVPRMLKNELSGVNFEKDSSVKELLNR